MSNQLFTPGQVGVTSSLLADMIDVYSVDEAAVEFSTMLRRHLSGDWGNVDPHDARCNWDALKFGSRILSVYNIGEIKVYVITEADRSHTTIMKSEDY